MSVCIVYTISTDKLHTGNNSVPVTIFGHVQRLCQQIGLKSNNYTLHSDLRGDSCLIKGDWRTSAHAHTTPQKNYNTQLNNPSLLAPISRRNSAYLDFFVSCVSRGETHTPHTQTQGNYYTSLLTLQSRSKSTQLVIFYFCNQSWKRTGNQIKLRWEILITCSPHHMLCSPCNLY